MSRRASPRTGWALLFAVALSLTTAGCARRKRIMECNHFIDKVNLSLREINKYTKTRADDPKLETNMRTLAKLFKKLATDIQAMHISSPGLAPHTRRYREMCEHSATAALHLADAVSKDDVKEVKSADLEFKGVVKSESELIRKINGVCSR